MQAIHTEMGATIAIFTMATRTVQILVSLAKPLVPRRFWLWKYFPADWISKAARSVMWICCSVLGLLREMEDTKEIYNKKRMNSDSVGCFQKGLMESQDPSLHEKNLSCCRFMLQLQDMDQMTLTSSWEDQCYMEAMVNKDAVLSTCTNPILLSLVCLPLEDGDVSTNSESSSLHEIEMEDDQLWDNEEDSCSTENISTDSGMQELWTPGSKNEGNESDWSDEDSWDSESETGCSNEDEELWASFCRRDDPYNPLSFCMPTKSPKKTDNLTKKKHTTDCIDSTTTDCVKNVALLRKAGHVNDVKKQSSSNSFTIKRQSSCVKPTSQSVVMPGHEDTESHQSTPVPLEPDHIKRVHFSPTVTVHRMVVWDYAHRMARKGPWEENARDRCRFQKRISDTQAAIGYCLEQGHRQKTWNRLQELKSD